MKKLILLVLLVLTVSFVFATNNNLKNSTFVKNNINKLVFDKITGTGQCWVQVRVTATNTETGESYSYTYWAYVGTASDLADCKKKAATYVAAL